VFLFWFSSCFIPFTQDYNMQGKTNKKRQVPTTWNFHQIGLLSTWTCSPCDLHCIFFLCMHYNLKFMCVLVWVIKLSNCLTTIHRVLVSRNKVARSIMLNFLKSQGHHLQGLLKTQMNIFTLILVIFIAFF